MALRSPWKKINHRYVPCQMEDGETSLGMAKTAQDFLRILKENIDDHLLAREERKSNYEDLHAAAAQILEDAIGTFPNPLIGEFVQTIQNATTHLCSGNEYELGKELLSFYRENVNGVAVLADEAANLIQWVVYHGLRGAIKPCGLDTISEVARAVGQMDIFTLNHDVLIERQLQMDKTIQFCNGFSNIQNGNVRWFDNSWTNSDAPVRMLKLHGSISWYWFRKANEQVSLGCVDSLDPDDCRDENGELLELAHLRPPFLTGTFFKDRAYGVGLFGDIFAEFRARLRECNTIICCGYGWRDSGINTRLHLWLNAAQEHRIVILLGDTLEEVSRNRFWSRCWNEYVNKKVFPIQKWLSKCTLADLEPYLY